MSAEKYKIIDRLAVGGTAEIFRAAQRTSSSMDIVVIKRLSPSSRADDGLRTLFELEADLGRRLDHPHIARMVDMGFENSDLFIVFEYLDGPHLQKVLDESRKRELLLPFEVSAAILCNLLDALHYAHELRAPTGESLGLIHRDINPRNVLTSFEGRVALIDFGIARTQELEGGRAEEVVRGKLGSVAPEQLRREPLDRRADVFACGVMMYELLIGSHPFTHAGMEEEKVLK
ncbi:MAG: serine/threonine-protein kinase, partial [Myxococcota bacterium]